MQDNSPGDQCAPKYMSRGGKYGHSALEARDAAIVLGEWLEQNPDRSLWSFRIPLANTQKLFVHETGGELVFYTEATPVDCDSIMDILGNRKSLDDVVRVLTSDGLDMLEAAEVAAML